jgi:hypothetical protein
LFNYYIQQTGIGVHIKAHEAATNFEASMLYHHQEVPNHSKRVFMTQFLWHQVSKNQTRSTEIVLSSAGLCGVVSIWYFEKQMI